MGQNPKASIKAEKNFWSVKEAARYLGIAPLTLYCWIAPKKYCNPKTPGTRPPFYRFGPSIRIPITEFKNWTEQFRGN